MQNLQPLGRLRNESWGLFGIGNKDPSSVLSFVTQVRFLGAADVWPTLLSVSKGAEMAVLVFAQPVQLSLLRRLSASSKTYIHRRESPSVGEGSSQLWVHLYPTLQDTPSDVDKADVVALVVPRDHWMTRDPEEPGYPHVMLTTDAPESLVMVLSREEVKLPPCTPESSPSESTSPEQS